MTVAAATTTKTAEELAAEAAAAAPVVEDTDNFAAAFEELAKLGDKPVTPEAIAGKPPVPVPVKDATDETGTGDDDGTLPNPDTQIAEAEAAAAAAKEPVVTPAPVRTAADDVLERLVERLAPKPAVETPAPPEPDFTPEEASFIKKYTTEFPDIAQAETLIRRAEYKHVLNYMFEEVRKALAPMTEQLGQLSTRTHVADLQSVVEDYADVRGKVVEWIGTQPDYLQAAYNNVVQHGTKEQVIDLISRYRTASGTAAPAAQPATSGTVRETELPAPAKQAAALLAPVSSKRSAVIVSPSNEDFDGAFANFAKET